MNYNSLMNKPTINYRELIGDNTVTEVGGMTEEQFNTLLTTDLSSYYTKAEIDDLFARSFVYREKSGSIVTFDCPTSITTGISEVTSEIVAVQSGTGDPSPTNVRPINGWSAVNVVVSPTTDVEDGTTYTIQLGDTYYGATLDVVSGELTVTHTILTKNTANLGGSSEYPWWTNSGVKAIVGSGINKKLTGVMTNFGYENSIGANTMSSNDTLFLYGSETAYTLEEWKALALECQFIIPLAPPQTIQLTPTAVKSLLGTNNLWADSGDITVKALDRIIQE